MTKSVDNRQKWIEMGYELFGKVGPEALNAEKLSNLVGLQRSSFYHYFKTLEGFENALFEHHIKQYKNFRKIIQHYVKFEQLLSQEIFDHQGALAFQRQLMINQRFSRYKKCMDEALSYTLNITFKLWHSSSMNNINLETDSILFNALRDFFFVHYGESNENTDPKEVLLRLQKYFNSKS